MSDIDDKKKKDKLSEESDKKDKKKKEKDDSTAEPGGNADDGGDGKKKKGDKKKKEDEGAGAGDADGDDKKKKKKGDKEGGEDAAAGDDKKKKKKGGDEEDGKDAKKGKKKKGETQAAEEDKKDVSAEGPDPPDAEAKSKALEQEQAEMEDTTATLLKTIQSAVQTLGECGSYVEDVNMREAIVGKQRELLFSAQQIQKQGPKTQPGGQVFATSLHPATMLASTAYSDEGLAGLVHNLEELDHNSPLMRSERERQGWSAKDLVSRKDATASRVGQRQGVDNNGSPNEDGLSLYEDRPISVNSATFESDVDYVRQVRRKISMAKEGKDITAHGPGDEAWYEIDDAEKDVVDLKRMRRQIRCLFGPNMYADDMHVVASNVKLPKMGNISPTSMNSSPTYTNANTTYGQQLPISQTSYTGYDAPQTTGKSVGSAKGKGKGGKLDSMLKNAGANWAEEVVKAAVQPGNQWSFNEGDGGKKGVSKGK